VTSTRSRSPFRRALAGLAASTIVLAAFATGARADTPPPPPQQSWPIDTSPFARPVQPGDVISPLSPLPPGATLVDTVVSNTDPNLTNTDTFVDSEPSIAVDPNNTNHITIEGFSSCWNAVCDANTNAALWTSTDGGVTWTKSHSVPPPPNGLGTGGGCPCDQTPDYDRSSHLFSTFLAEQPVGQGSVGHVYSGSSTDPTNANAWSWHVTAGTADQTNASGTNADQPWLLVNRDPTTSTQDDTYVAYDDFGTSPPTAHVAASLGLAPPSFTRDHSPGQEAGCCVNPGLRLAVDHANGTVYALYQQATFNSATSPKINIQYFLNRSMDGGQTWSLNGNAGGIQIASGPSDQVFDSFTAAGFKFGTVNALLGGIDSGAVDPTNGDVYYVYGLRDTGTGNNRLLISRLTPNGSGGLTVGSPTFITGQVQAALPSVSVASNGTIGVMYDTFDGFNGSGFPIFTAHLAQSTDHAATFNDTALLTFTSPQKNNTNDSRQRVLGDYQQLKAVGTTFFGTFTANGASFGRSISNTDAIFVKVPAAVPQTVLPGISVSDVDVLEGNSGTTAATFVVSLSANPSSPVTVNFATANSTATAGSDYVAVPTTALTWNPGDPLTKTVNVTVNGDTLKEGNEAFLLKLSSPSGATLSDSQGTGTIIDEEGTFYLSINDASVVESNSGTTSMNFPVSLSAAPATGQTVTVKVNTADGTATAGSGDYVALPVTTLTWHPGDPLTKTVSVTVNGDTTVEPDETFLLKLSSPSKNAVISDTSGTGTILNDDGSPITTLPPTVSVGDLSILEGNSGTATAAFKVTLSADPSSTVSVKISTANQTATAGSDYVAVPMTTLTWNPGDPLTKTQNVTINGDTLKEGNEAFLVKLTSPSGVTVADTQGTGTIIDEEGRFFLSVSDPSVTEGNTGTTAMNFTVSVSATPGTGQTVTVKVASADGTATSASGDYVAVALTTLTWNPGDPLTKTVAVTVNGDTVVEPNETLFLNLSTASKNAVISDTQGTGTIVNDD
jgi:hypothetical protein